MTGFACYILGVFLFIGRNIISAFTARLATSTTGSVATTSLFWGDGENAAPAVICDIDNIPILEPIPEG